uniref:UGT91V1 n=1 Tax=Panax ginseng TaxID=4054 RepID=A0A7G3KE51_PANGI|nr:UGT91V1 [Panax ginseng]
MAANDKLHIVMFPWLAFGHILPYLKLAKLIAKKGHKISFISTPRNIDRLPKIPPNLAPHIDLVKFPLPSIPNLPENAEATIDVPFNKVKYLKIAYDQLQQPLTQFLVSNSPNWILFDIIAYWVCPIASKLNVRSSFFSIFSASIMGYFGPPSVLMHNDEDRRKPEDYSIKPKWVRFETTVAVSLHQMQRMFVNFTEDETENVPDQYRIAASIRDCEMVAVRSSSVFEPEWLELLDEIYQKPVVQVGLLPTDTTDTDTGGKGNDSWRDIKDWLDKQEKGSVIYVAFGAETKPNQDELTELALGLELSGLPFIWALRKQRGSADPEPTELPEGFEERTRGRGLVYTSWVPQTKILSHDSVGGLLIHSGWSSVIEAVQFGRALVLLPLLADQELIAKLVEEKKMGYLIPRNERDGWFSRDSVAESVRLVMVDEEGKIYRDNVKEMKGVFGDMDKQDEYVDNLLSYLESHKILTK